MGDILVKSFGFVLVIMIAYIMKQLKILHKEDGHMLSKIIMNVTLPCALLANANSVQVESAMIILLIAGFFSNIFMIIVAYILSKKDTGLNQGMYMINCSGYNIGNFVLPYVQSFFPGMGIAYLCMFDIGNAIMCLGGSYALAGVVVSSKEKLTLKMFIRKLTASIPFDVYIIVFFLALLNIEIPNVIIQTASFIGAGNAFLAMFMIGLLLELDFKSKEIKIVYKILAIRLIFGFVLMALVYFFLPVPLLAKKIAILGIAGPLTSVSPVFSRNIGYDGDAPAVANSCSIIYGIALLTGLIIIFQ